MAVYQGLAGKVYIIKEDKVAKGGEGSIHLIENSDAQVAKIFTEERRTVIREEKIRHMVEFPVKKEILGQVTWPEDILYDHSGFVGYIMPRLKYADSLTNLYSEEKYNLKERLLAAINLCVAVDAVHEMGQVCGDLNPQNICINLNRNDNHCFQVTLVDSDSYHFITPDKIYRCEVGLADYLAPEIQKKLEGGADLRTAELPTFTRETDLFALAVHIFSLLMNGCHPFACAKGTNETYEAADDGSIRQMDISNVRESDVAPQPIENIKDGFFPFYDTRKGITYPLYAPAFYSLPARIRDMFVQTFKEGYMVPSKRITAKEWIEGLKAESNNITDICCERNTAIKHQYFAHISKCPFCEAEERMIKKLKPIGFIPDSASKPISTSNSNLSSETGSASNIVSSSVLKQTKNSSLHFESWFENHKNELLAVSIVMVLVLFIWSISSATISNEKNADINNEKNADLSEHYMTVQEYIDEAEEQLGRNNFDEARDAVEEAREMTYLTDEQREKLSELSDKIDERKAEWEQELEREKEEEERLEEERKKTEQKARKVAAKKKADAKKLKKLNPIIAAIKKKEYKKAGSKVWDYCINHSFSKIYVQNGRVVNKIKSGKGFMISHDEDCAYYGSFKDGKRSGKGVDVGDGFNGNYYVKGTYKNGKLNGKAVVFLWEQVLGNKKYRLKISGKYKNNKENGRMALTYIKSNGKIDGTYYCRSSKGKRKVILYDKKVGYVFAETSSGYSYIGNLTKSRLSGHGHPAYYWE